MLPSDAATPPSAITVCALPSRDLHTTRTLQPASRAATTALRPAPPAPTINTSDSNVSYEIILEEPHVVNHPSCQAAHIKVGDDNGKQAAPRPKRMVFVKVSYFLPYTMACFCRA